MESQNNVACDCSLCGEPPFLRDGGDSVRYECRHCGMRTAFRKTAELSADEWNAKSFKFEADLFRPTKYIYN